MCDPAIDQECTNLPPLDPISIKLWMITLAEHPEFLAQLTANPIQKQRFAKLAILMKAIVAKSIESSDDTTEPFDDTFFEALSLLEELQEAEIQMIQSNPFVIEPVYIALVIHMLMEQQAVVKSMLGQSTLEDELQFIKNESAQHTDLLGKTLDPISEMSKVSSLKAQELAYELESHQEFNSHVLDDLTQSDILGKMALSSILEGSMRALITPKMIAHEIREALLGNIRLLQFNTHNLISLSPIEKQTILKSIFSYPLGMHAAPLSPPA